MPPDTPQLHRSFLLRLWRAGNGNAPQWRMSIEDTRTHERLGFADVAGLVVFLEEQIRGVKQPQSYLDRNNISNEEDS